MKPRPLLRAAFLLGLLAYAGRAVMRRRTLIQPVPPALRSPALWVPFPPFSERSVKVVRSLMDRMPEPRPASGTNLETCFIDRRDGGQIRILLHQPAERRRPSGALLWIHGGGLVIGKPEQSVPFCNTVAAELGILVANVDYRLAPEDPFPAGLDDCIDALEWLHDRAGELGVDPARVAVGGDSAGGGLAAAVCQRVHDAGGPPVALQVLVYPMLDDRTVLRADHRGTGSFIWTPASNAYGWTAYLGHAPTLDELPPYAAPARRTDLSGLPPAWIGIGDLDLFYEEDVDYARRLEAAGVPCQLEDVPGMYHGADAIVAEAPASIALHESLRAALRTAVGATTAA